MEPDRDDASGETGQPPSPAPRVDGTLMRATLLVAAGLLFGAPSVPLAAALDRSTLVPTFAEEFSGPLDLWHARTNPKGRWKPNYESGTQDPASPSGWSSRNLKGNRELQVYTGGIEGAPQPYQVRNGELVITATRTPAPLRKRLWGHAYTSGVITTAKSFSQRYGYFEMRARMPEGQGLWPAFWLLPADGSWPPEIDVVEMLGHQPDTHYATVHYAEKGAHKQSGEGIRRLKLSKQHVTFGVLWTPEELVWYQDDVEVRRAKNPSVDKPMYMLVNLAVGGNWPGAPDKHTKFPAQMRVDYVRAFTLKPTPKAVARSSQARPTEIE